MEERYMVSKIAISKINYKSDILYSYKVPSELESQIQLGMHVMVPFGQNNRKYEGIIFEINYSEDIKNLKSIYAVLDLVPFISCEMMEIIKFIKSNCFCTYYEAAKLMLPKDFKKRLKEISYKISDISCDLSIKEEEFLSKLSSLNKKDFSLNDIKNLKVKNFNKLLNNLISKNVITENILNYSSQKENHTKFLKLSSKVSISSFKLTNKQLKVCEFLKNKQISSIREISEDLNISTSVVNGLIKKGIIIKTDFKAKENTFNGSFKESSLSEEQNEVFNKILDVYRKNSYTVSLIHGVTGSGKTRIILKLIDEVLKENKSVIFLVPEIALTLQFIEIFTSKYKDKVAVFHSKLSNSERSTAWKNIKSGKISIVLGARNAIFAPFENLGLIVIDEEHEFTYKSEFTPRFDARDIARYRAKFNKCMLIFSSATPSVESYYMARTGKYNLFTLKHRYGIAVLPKAEIIDINDRFNEEGEIIFSDELICAIKENIKREKQTMLLINRRGFNTFVKCLECGEVQVCPYCSVSLTYHKTRSQLICHYCGYYTNDIDVCFSCKEKRLIYLGFGTQKAQYQLEKLIPDAKILRIDSDTKMDSQEEMIKSFEKENYNILIGTQMISKGFNFPNVTLVGVLMADQYLYSSDFRAYEKTFSLITQTIGRAGRGSSKGKAIVQTFTPENEILVLAANQDYVSFFEKEIVMRKLMLNPPFADICLIMFRGKNRTLISNVSSYFFEFLKKIANEKYNDIPLRIFPPGAATIEKVAENYRYKIIIKCKNSKKFREMIHEAILKVRYINLYRNVYIGVDINPTSIL